MTIKEFVARMDSMKYREFMDWAKHEFRLPSNQMITDLCERVVDLHDRGGTITDSILIRAVLEQDFGLKFQRWNKSVFEFRRPPTEAQDD